MVVVLVEKDEGASSGRKMGVWVGVGVTAAIGFKEFKKKKKYFSQTLVVKGQALVGHLGWVLGVSVGPNSEGPSPPSCLLFFFSRLCCCFPNRPNSWATCFVFFGLNNRA